MDKSDIIKYQLPDEIIKNIHKKKDLYNIILVCRAWYHCGIKYLYSDFSYEYTLLKIPTTTQLEWVKHYHTWIDAAQEKRHFQLYTLLKGMKRLESIHIDIFGHIKYFKRYRKFLYKFADLKKDQIKTLHISLDILDEYISGNSLMEFKTIFTQFIKIFKNLDVLILESGEENPIIDIQRLMIECLANVYTNNNNSNNNSNSSNVTHSRSLITTEPSADSTQNNNNNNNNNEINIDEEHENENENDDDESDDEGTIISDIEISSDSEDEIEYDEDSKPICKRHRLKKLIIYDNNSINIEDSLSDIISIVPLEELIIHTYTPKQSVEPISSFVKSAEPFWRINRYKKELLSKYPEYFSSLTLENQNNRNYNNEDIENSTEDIKNIFDNKQSSNYENLYDRSKDMMWRKFYYVYNKNIRKREAMKEHDHEYLIERLNVQSDYEDYLPTTSYENNIDNTKTSTTTTITTTTNTTTTPITTTTTNNNNNNDNNSFSDDNKSKINLSSSLRSNCSLISNLSDSSCTTMVNSFSNDLSKRSTPLLNNIETYIPKKSVNSILLNTHLNDDMTSLYLENCQSISVKLFSIILPKLNHLSTIKLSNISFLPEFCILKLLIGSGKNLHHLKLNLSSQQLTQDIIVCIATENSNLETLSLKSCDHPLIVDVETINWMLTLCPQLYSFTIENADETVHNYYKKNYNLVNSSYHQSKKTILNKTVIGKVKEDTLINYERTHESQLI
ncbi:hypothetical protein H8356DRAFT_1047571 [Neocallimastix lanati (nom. inval.)]|nr:hypothetical protein H8356DRAFT_1047571 [Neocallimastix sp. JGI-2020a]